MDNRKWTLLSALVLFMVTILSFNHRNAIMIWKKTPEGVIAEISQRTLPSVNNEMAIKTRIKLRTMGIKERCKSLYSTTYPNPLKFKYFRNGYPWIYFSDKYKLLYCHIPEIGSASWLKNVANLQEEKLNASDDSIDPTSTEIKRMHFKRFNPSARILRNYKKIVVIREPFERIVSAYESKFLPRGDDNIKANLLTDDVTGNSDSFKEYAEAPEISDDEKFNGSFTTFNSFIRYITNTEYKDISHLFQPLHLWKPQIDLCYHCLIKYDYVLDFDHFESEAKFLLKFLEISSNVSYPEIKKRKKSNATQAFDDVTLDYVSKASPQLLSALSEYYTRDYEIFNYKEPANFIY